MEYLTFFENTHKKIFFYRRIVLKVVLYYFQIVNLFFGKKERYHMKKVLIWNIFAEFGKKIREFKVMEV